VGTEYLDPHQGNLLDLVLGAHKQSQDFTLSECKLGLHGASRALAANKIKQCSD